MLKKIRILIDQYAIPAAFIVFILLEFLQLGLGRLLSLLPETLPMSYLKESILIIVPVALVFFFGFARTFKRGSLLRGLLCILPFIIWELLMLASFFLNNLGNPEASWKPWYLIVYGVFSVIGIGIREECIYRAVIQNIVAKKHAKNVKGIWLTATVAAIIFGLCHMPNLFFGMNPTAVLSQVITATFMGLLFGAVYLRSGSIWTLMLVHTLIDTTSLAKSIFLDSSDLEIANRLSFSWSLVIFYLILLGFTAFLLRPSKCQQIRESLCFADEESESTIRTQSEI